MGCGDTHLPFDLATTTGKWQVNFVADVTGNQRTGGGFLGQVGPNITGAFVLAGTCAGKGNVTGSVDRQDLTMNLSQIGQKLALIGTISQDNKAMTGTYSSTITSCVTVPETGSWNAVQVQPVNGTFSASFTSSQGLGAVHLTGTLTQQPKPNGGTPANLNGPLSSSDSPCVLYPQISPSQISSAWRERLRRMDVNENCRPLQHCDFQPIRASAPRQSTAHSPLWEASKSS